MKPLILLTLPLLLLVAIANAGQSDEKCEVCVKTIAKFLENKPDEVKSDPKKLEEAFRKFCEGSKGKENRFCYYLGGLSNSATGILGEMSKPLSWSMPIPKVCEKLKKLDPQICDLRYDKLIDVHKVDLKKLKVRDLKKILNDWDEVCEGCIEKSDFINRINELKPKYPSSSQKSEL